MCRSAAVLFAVALLSTRGTPHNILHIHSDDHRADALHALGAEALKTPNLDTLVTAGTSFTRACTRGFMTGAVCTPSRTMMLPGRSWQRNPGAPGAADNAGTPATFLPLVIAGPGIIKARSEALDYLMDLFPALRVDSAGAGFILGICQTPREEKGNAAGMKPLPPLPSRIRLARLQPQPRSLPSP